MESRRSCACSKLGLGVGLITNMPMSIVGFIDEIYSDMKEKVGGNKRRKKKEVVLKKG